MKTKKKGDFITIIPDKEKKGLEKCNTNSREILFING